MRLLVTGAAQLSQERLDSLTAAGHEVWFLQQEADALPLPCEKIEGVICNGLFMHHDAEDFTALRYVQLTSAGFDRVPLEHLTGRGITVRNARGVYSIPMAEYAVGGVLQLYKGLETAARQQRAHLWQKQRSLRELSGKRVCIVGCGSVGTECAKRFAAFGCRVTGVDILPEEKPGFDSVLPLERLTDATAQADILVLCLPLTEQTRYLIDENILAALPDGAVVVNIARGAVVDTRALLAELQSKRLQAVLDVFEEEPLPPDSPLWDMEGVVVTPHNSFVGEGCGDRLWQVIQEGLEGR